MNERTKYPIVITVICLIAAAGLAVTYVYTKDPIAASLKSELVAGLETVLPKEKKSIEERTLKNGVVLYVARENADKTGKELGYAAVGEARGYSSTIVVMVGTTPDGSIYGIRILSQQETPGLGERTKEVPPTKSLGRAVAEALGGGAKGDEKPQPPPFQGQFAGRTLDQLVLVREQGSKDRISQITGATITSQGVVNAVRAAVNTINAARAAGAPESDRKAG